MFSRNALRRVVALLAGVALAAAALHAADAPKAPADLHGDALPVGAVARLGTTRFRAPSASVAYAPDGKLLAAGGSDNKIRLIDPATGKLVRELAGHTARTYQPARDAKSAFDLLVSSVGEGNVTAVAFSPDGKVLASGGWDDMVRLWDVKTGEELRKVVAHKAMVAAVAFSSDGKFLASRGGLDGIVRIWDPATGAELRKFEALSKINPWRFNRATALAFAPDGKTLAVGDAKVIRLFDPATGKQTGTLDAHPSTTCVAYSADGKTLASGGIDGNDKHSLRLWDVATGKELRRCELPKDEPPIDAAFSPDGKSLAAVIEEDDLRVFDVATGKPLHRLGHYWPSRVAFAPDGKALVSARGPVLRLWDPATGKELFQQFEGHQSSVSAAVISPDGKMIATAGDGVRLWDAATGKPSRRIEAKGRVAVLAFSPDGKTLAYAGTDRLVHLWDVTAAKAAGELKGHKHQLCGLAFSPDGKTLASGDVQATVRLWDVAGAKERQAIDMKSGTESLSLAFAPDNKTLACAGAWNDSSFLPAGGINIQGVQMTPKQGYRVLLWDAETGKEVRHFEGLTDNVKSLAFSPDGKALAAASRDGRVAVWDAATGKDRLYVLAHPNQHDTAFSPTPCVAFAPDGKSLITAGTDGTARVWDVATAKERGRYHSPGGGFHALAVTQDGKRLVTAGADTAAIVWDLTAPPKPAPPARPNAIFIQ
jgi:WD40 repeat protein